MKYPLVSICIPVYNRVSLIEETINSALNQTYANIEIIINDNQSTDGTWTLINTIAEKHKTKIKVFQNETNVGAVKNWQKVIEKSKGDFIHILWSDDIINPEFIEATLNQFDDETSFVIAENAEFNDDGIQHHKTYPFTEIASKDFLNDILLFNKNGFLPSPVIALFRNVNFQRKVISHIPNSDNIDFNRTGAGPDILIFLISALERKKIKFIPQLLVLNRSHEDSITVIENKKEGLKLSYDWGKFYFIKNYYRKLLFQYTLISIYRLFKYNFKHKNLIRQVFQ